MKDLIVLGTDTEVGKTTFALLWMASFGGDYEYWKPLESGEPDSALVARLVPGVRVHPAAARFRTPVAPPLAAKREGRVLPSLDGLLETLPRVGNRALLIETFGSAFSPMGDDVLQVALIRALDRPTVLVASSDVGAIGRTLQSLLALESQGIDPIAVVLVGRRDSYAGEQIERHREGVQVFALGPPASFDPEGVARAAHENREALESIRALLPEHWGDSASVVDRDAGCVWHPYTSLRDPDPPLVVVGAHDEYLELSDGTTLIDGVSSWWTIQHGHRFPPLMRALREAAARYDHVHFAGMTHPPAVELGERMLDTLPWKGGRVFYSDNGSTAVEVALKMAYQCWCHRGESHRTRFVGFQDGYHGDTFGAMSVSRDPVFFGRFEPLMFTAEILPLSAERLDDFLTRSRDDIAAVIVEPLVQGAGGMKMHSPERLRALFEVTRRHGVIFIADEVMTGGGRTGSLWAHSAASIEPDLVCAGKTIAGGILPIAVTLAAPHVVDAFDTPDRTRTFFHGHSFTAHPLACAVGAANWRSHLADVGSRAARMERFWRRRLDGLRSARGVREVRIRGTIAAVELDVEGGYLAGVGRKLRELCLERGVLLRPLGSVLYTLPPLRTSPESLERIAAALCETVEIVTRAPAKRPARESSERG